MGGGRAYRKSNKKHNFKSVSKANEYTKVVYNVVNGSSSTNSNNSNNRGDFTPNWKIEAKPDGNHHYGPSIPGYAPSTWKRLLESEPRFIVLKKKK